MKTLNVPKLNQAKQAGFTIIELVVVILLLGILTATALPRFLDVTDEAHDAVVDAVRGGWLTGNALFRAGYVAEGENNAAAVGSFGAGTVFSVSTGEGYPADLTDGVIDDEADCLALYNAILQTGRPLAAAAAFDTSAATLEGNIEAAADADTQFVITGNSATPTGCVAYYVGQFKGGNTTTSARIPTLTYTSADGDVVRADTYVMNLID